VSVTLSPPIRVFALLGVLVAVGLGAFFFLLAGSGSETEATSPLTTPTRQTIQQPPTRPPATPARPPRTSVVPPSGFPAPVHRALRRNRVVVIAVYMPRASVDAYVRREARAAAIATRAGFVAISATSERLVGPLVAKTGVLPDPAVVVVRRPDVVVSTLSVADRETVTQAIAQARRR
jgi:hypothetical protein